MNDQVLRVLIVDDEESIRRPLADRLREFHHFYVDVAGDGLEALDVLAQAHGRYDVAVIDQVLEGEINGLELLGEIKARYPEIQTIVFTGWGLKEDEGINILRQGAYRYIAKGNYDELALTIRFAAEEGWARLERRYMAALVKVGQGLTQAIKQDEQLKLVWDFVREQLEVSTFFIALYSPKNKKIHFPLAYDEDLQTRLADVTLGQNRQRWGLAGYVLKTGEEILWSTQEEMAQVCKTRGIKPFIAGKPSASGFCASLRMSDAIRGVISAQSYHPYVFTPVLQNALRALSSLLCAALDNSRLFAEAEQKTLAIKHQANSLSALQGLALTMNQSLKLDEILTKTCQAAVELFGADHSGLVLFDPDPKEGTVVAEYPMLNACGKRIPIAGVPAEEKLVDTRQPLSAYDVNQEKSLGPVGDILRSLQIQSILFVPVVGKEGVIGSFSLDAIRSRRHFTREEISMCKTFSDQVAVAIENARLFEAEAQRRQEAETLREIALALTTTLEQQEIFERILCELQKVVPYDSASVQLLKGKCLEIIGGRGFPNLSKLIGISFPIDGENPNCEVVNRNAYLIVPDAPRVYKNFSQEPHTQANIHGWLGVPMQVGERVIGMIALDKKEPNFYNREHARLAQAFASQAAIVIENSRLYNDVQEGRDYIRALFNASNGIISAHDPATVLNMVVKMVCEATGAWRAVILLIDQNYRKTTRILAETGYDSKLEPAKDIRLNGYSTHAIKANTPFFLPDTLTPGLDIPINPHMVERGTRAAACLPLMVRSGNPGVLWIEYKAVHNFSKTEEQALQLFATQAAIAYDNARRLQELEQLRLATEAMTSVAEPIEILLTIAKSARQVLNADISMIWSYDAQRDIFKPEEFVADGVAGDRLKKFRQEEHKVGKTTRYVLKKGYVKVSNITTTQAEYMGDSTRTFLEELGITSFQSIRLEVAGEALGILHVDYKEARIFGEDEKKMLEHFANQAALTLKRARLLAQITKARETARVVAKVSTLGNLGGTIKTIVEGAHGVLNCDIVTLYTFDEKSQRFIHVEGIGLRDLHNMRLPEEILPASTLWRIIRLGEPYYHVAVRARSDRVFQGAFVEQEGVQSAMGIQLRFSNERVGVMFVNYLTAHHFTDDEISDAIQFGDQAAVAIHNAQRFGEVERVLAARTALAWTGMVGSTWRHAIEKHAITIREQTQLLRSDLAESKNNDAILKRLEMVERLANKILEKPITPPLSAEEGGQSVPVNKFIKERINQLKTHDPSVNYRYDFSLADQATIRASPEWLRRALDILLDNALDSTQGLSIRLITIATRMADRCVEILIGDNGPGIPKGIQEHIFSEPIRKPQGAKGLGMGLLLAQMIVNTFGGEIGIEKTGDKGTTMLISLPIETGVFFREPDCSM